MGVSSVFKRGQKEDKFVSLLIQQSEIIAAGLRLLEEWVKAPKVNNQAVNQMREKEISADEVRRILIDELHNTFVTPFDREDIFMLSLYFDNILDYAYTTAEAMRLLLVDADEHLTQMVTDCREAAEELELAVKRLSSNPRVAGDHARRAKKLENEVDHHYRVAIGELFTATKDFDPLMLMLRRREVYRHVSNMADQADKAADVMGMLVMKLI